MASCHDKWLNVFVTKPDSQYGEDYTFDDEFLCTVQSVQISEVTANGRYASIVGEATNYLMPTWSAPYSRSGEAIRGGFSNHRLRSVVPGDIVRIGNAGTGHTDYLTVVEIIHCKGS